MAVIMMTSPILPGKREAWRRFCQEMMGSRHEEYEASRRSLGVIRELSWLSLSPTGDQAIVYLEAADVAQTMGGIASSERPFDRWFRQQVLDIHGLDLTQPPRGEPNELALEWQNEGSDGKVSD